MGEIRVFLAAVEKRVVDEHFKKVCNVTVEVSLAKLASSHKEQAARFENIVQNVQSHQEWACFQGPDGDCHQKG